MMSWRVLLLMVLTVLLPLRSALAVTMGLPVAPQPVSAQPHAQVSAQATHTLHAIDSNESPCPHHAMAAHPSDTGTSDAAADDTDGHNGHPGQAHLLCDVCNGPALSARIPVLGVMHALPLGRPERIERFDSVVLPIGHKPPIPA